MKKIILSTGMIALLAVNAFATTTVTYTVLGQRSGPVTGGPGGVSANCGDDTFYTCFTYTTTQDDVQSGPQRGNPTVVNTYDSNGRPDGHTYSGGWVSIERVPNGNLVTYTVDLTNLKEN